MFAKSSDRHGLWKEVLKNPNKNLYKFEYAEKINKRKR